MKKTIQAILLTGSALASGVALAQVPPMPPGPPPMYHQGPMVAGPFDMHHPKVVELNRRLDFESHKLDDLMYSGQLDPRRGRMIRNQLHAVRENIRATFRTNGGFLTPDQFRGFSYQENQIRNELNIVF